MNLLELVEILKGENPNHELVIEDLEFKELEVVGYRYESKLTPRIILETREIEE